VHLAENDTTWATFEFKIDHVFAKTQVEITNVNPVTGPASPSSDVYLDGSIENPIGRTYVKNVRGGIFADNALDLNGIESTGVNSMKVAIFGLPGSSDTDVEKIRTNILELDADTGSIGRQADTGPAFVRVPIAAEVIRFRRRGEHAVQ